MRHLIGSLGDVHPLKYGGKLVYRVTDDHKGVADFELDILEPGGEDGSSVVRYTIGLENIRGKWFIAGLPDVAETSGLGVVELYEAGESKDPMQRAWFYSELVDHFGAREFDSYPVTFTEAEAIERYRAEFKAARANGINVHV